MWTKGSAYAELYITTGQEKFKQAFQDSYDPQWIDIFEWKNPAAMGVWHLILAEEKGEFRDQLINDLDRVAVRYIQQAQQSPFRVANQRFIWGSNKMTAEAGILIAWQTLPKGAWTTGPQFSHKLIICWGPMPSI